MPRILLLALNLLCLLTFATSSMPLPAWAQDEPSEPTAEAIREYVEDSIARDVQMNLVKRFGTNFRDLDLRGIDFKGVYRAGAETILSGADFSGADLRGVDFGSALLDGANFQRADLRGARFTTVKFDQADFTGAVIGDVRFQECFFNGTKLTGLDFSQAALNGCYFKNANLDGAVLQGVRNELGWRRTMTESSLRDVDLSGFDFSLGNLSGTNLKGANLTGINFKQTDLRGANLDGATLVDVVFEAAILDGVTGLDDSRLKVLQDQADRAGFEEREAAKARSDRIRKTAFGWSYLVIVLLAFACCGIAGRHSTGKVWPITLILVNFVAVIPALFFYAVTHYETELIAWKGHTDIGRAWIAIWPLAAIGSLAMIIGGLVLVVVFAIWSAKGPKDTRIQAKALIAAASLTIAHGAFLFVYAFDNAPTV